MDIKEIDIRKFENAGRIYTPSAPIELQQFFSGRKKQMINALNIMKQKGLHAVIYGERGVGKTSFANMLKIGAEAPNTEVVKVSCDTQDTFGSLWIKIFNQLKINRRTVQSTGGFVPTRTVNFHSIPASKFIDQDIGAMENIVSLLQRASNTLIIIDEFDRLDNDKFNQYQFADSLKNISDNIPHIKLIIVGVAENVSSLISHHESISRNLFQIYMPPMHNDELREIILKGETVLGIKFEKFIVEKIIDMSSRMPYITHSLCYYAVIQALSNNKTDIDNDLYELAVAQTIDQIGGTLTDDYNNAVASRRQNLYKEILYSASLTDIDEMGYFHANDLKQIIFEIAALDVQPRRIIYHLDNLCTERKRNILKRNGDGPRYRFSSPMMKAFVKLEGEKSVNSFN